MIARLLHLIDPGDSCWPALSLLSDLAAGVPDHVEHRVLIVGGGRSERIASAMGLPTADRMAPMLSAPALARRSLDRFIAARGAPDAIVAWSVSTAMLAQQIRCRAPVVAVLMLPPPPFEGAAQWTLAARAIRRSALIVYPSDFLRDSWVARFTLLGCPGVVLPPSPVKSPDHEARRRALRDEWKINEGATVILPMGEPSGAIDAHAAIFAAGVLGVAGFHPVVVTPPEAARLDRALRFAARIRPSRRVIVDDRPPSTLLPGCDLAMWFEPEGESTRPGRSDYTTPLGAVSLAWAEAAGIPIVAHNHPAWRSVLHESSHAIPVFGRTRRPLTHAILRAIQGRETYSSGVAGQRIDWGSRFEARIRSLLRERTRALVDAV